MSNDPPDGPPDAGDGPRDDGGIAEPQDAVEESPVAEEPPERDGPESSVGEDVTEYTTSVRTLDPAVRWLWIGRSLVYAAFVGGLVTVAGLFIAPGLVWVGGVAFALVALLGIGHALLLYRSWEYRVREDSVYLRRGVVTRVQTVVPYVRVQHIDTSRGPIERLVGLSSLVIYTAGSRGADVTVPGLVPEEAADLQTRLKVLAIESEGEDAV